MKDLDGLRVEMTLGEFMRGARESAGLSVEELAARISIRVGLLNEIEKNNFIHCGGDTYARGHLRNLAGHLLVDPQTLIDLYNEEHSSESRTLHDMLIENSVTKIPTEKKRVSWKYLASISILLLATVAGGQVVLSNSSNNSAPVATLSPSTTSSPSTSPTPGPTPSTEVIAPTGSQALTGEMELTISAARGNASIDVVTNGKTLYKGPILQGSSKSFSAPSVISIYLSNAGDLDLTLNGEQIAQLGARNEEIRKTFRSK